MTPEHCEVEINRLKRVLRGIPEDIYEYFGALQDVPDHRFTLAVNHALRTRAWFPSPAELRADVDATAPSAAVVPESRLEALAAGGRELVIVNPLNGQELRIPITRVWKFDCDDCGDTGWRSRACPSEPCGRRHEHDPHEFVEHCACREWNPTIRRRHAALGTKYAEAPAKVS